MKTEEINFDLSDRDKPVFNPDTAKELVKLHHSVKPKPVFRQSQVQHYFKCPKMYKLSLEFGDEIEPTMAMRQGLIFERFVLGEKPDHDEEKFRKEVYGKIQAPTVEFIKAQAERAKEYFLAGNAYVKLLYEADNYIIKGEADFVGEILFEGDAVECIADLKYTSNIQDIWNSKDKKSDFLQASFYPYMLYKLTGKLLPFIYVIVENTFTDPLIKQIKVDITDMEYSFNWLEKNLDTIVNDIWFEPRANENNCVGYRGMGKCRFLEFCSDGRELITSPLEIEFERLA